MITKFVLATVVLAAPGAASSCAATAHAGGAVPANCRAGLNKTQAVNARAVLAVADDMGMPRRAKVIAIATTLQESNLKRDAVGDGGRAVGVFQQHPHWGRNRTDPAASARRFFRELTKVKGWQSMPLTVAAQRVQRSARPTAYAKHEARATRIVATLTSCKESR